MFYYVVNFTITSHFKPILMFHFIVNFARIEDFISYFYASFCYEFCENQAIPSQCVLRFYLGDFVVQSFKSLWCFSPCCVLHPICYFVVVVQWIGREGLWFCVLFGKSVLGSLLGESRSIDYIFLYNELKGINFVLLMDELGNINIGRHRFSLVAQWIYKVLQHCCSKN